MKTALLYALLVAGQTADISTTCVGLKSGRFVERNAMLGQTCGSVAVRKASLTAASMAVYPWLRKRHPKWAVAVMLIPSATGFAGAAINIHIIRGAR
jgi:hypothetical protein